VIHEITPVDALENSVLHRPILSGTIWWACGSWCSARCTWL